MGRQIDALLKRKLATQDRALFEQTPDQLVVVDLRNLEDAPGAQRLANEAGARRQIRLAAFAVESWVESSESWRVVMVVAFCPCRSPDSLRKASTRASASVT